MLMCPSRTADWGLDTLSSEMYESLYRTVDFKYSDSMYDIAFSQIWHVTLWKISDRDMRHLINKIHSRGLQWPIPNFLLRLEQNPINLIASHFLCN